MPKSHKVKQGDCILSIAAKHGFLWESVWNHPDNSELKKQRKNPNVLQTGDVVVIPDKEKKEESAGADQHHRFVKKGVPAKLRLKITRNDEPRANEPFSLNIDGKYTEGQTDAKGMIDVAIPPTAIRGELLVGDGNQQEGFRFKLGTLDPIDSENGVKGRLRCLGYNDSMEYSELLREFQQKEELQVTGQLDEPTKNKIEERFGQ
jgi:hypothetical protein